MRVRCFSPRDPAAARRWPCIYRGALAKKNGPVSQRAKPGRKSTFVDALPTDEARNVPVPCPTFLSAHSELLHCPGPRQAAGVSKNVHCLDRAVGRSAPRFYGGIERVTHWLTEELVALGHDATLYASGDLVTSAKRGPRVWRNRVWAKSTTNLVRSSTVQPPRSTMQGRLPEDAPALPRSAIGHCPALRLLKSQKLHFSFVPASRRRRLTNGGGPGG